MTTTAEIRRDRLERLARGALPIRHPRWRAVEVRLDGAKYVDRAGRASLIWSIAKELDGRLWLHISVAGRDRLPTWTELVEAKEWVAGAELDGYQVIPRRSRYINQHEHALHVFVRLDGDDDALPDFTAGTGTL